MHKIVQFSMLYAWCLLHLYGAQYLPSHSVFLSLRKGSREPLV
jgi:hypothetical protein